jgi:murein DD-endopeptidase MepM/ murein hydrolase activator NlpD
VPTPTPSGPHRAARHRRPTLTEPAPSSLVPPLLAAATGVTLIAAGSVSLPYVLGDASPPTGTVAVSAADVAERKAAADRGSRSAGRADLSAGTMSLSEAAEAVTAEQQSAAAAKEAEEADRADRADRARAEAERTRWESPLRAYQLLGPEDEGVSLAAESGAPVYAIGTGTITYAGIDAEYGQMIVIEHWDGTVTYYCYLSSFEKTGGEVTVGELIGRVGNTGTTESSHLHLQIRPRGGEPVDPLPWLEKRGVDL